ncbi:hypothetical protein Rhopal_000666-T1 [Rhodotorula paludigena]|uniref:FAD dependent oxidoreductase domain-containing protein n=1 Tax=Rhodotorula paludigena TaxID=86838 RepID=A0AAV5G5C0_9BASI|nr:hypothetical protein Rhopal_000666-T1 [Rhodotorula paludigena]
MSGDALEVVILGSGIVGLCTAFYTLRLSPSARVTLVENSPAHQIAGGASSYSGGFIACGPAWHEAPSQALARLSWRLHVELAREFGGLERWGWRECGAVGLNVGGPGEDRSKYRTLPGGKKEGKTDASTPGEWVEGEKEVLDTDGGVGQIDPAQFCRFLHHHLSTAYTDRFSTIFGESIAILPASPVSRAASAFLPSSLAPSARRHLLVKSPSSHLRLPFDRLCIAAGPWSAAVCATLGLPPIPLTNLPGHSLLIRPALKDFVPLPGAPHALPAQAVFAGISGAVGGVHASTSGLARGLTDEEKAEGFTRAPELFTRVNGLVFVAGENTIPETRSQEPSGLPNKLPPRVDEVKDMIDQRLVGRLKRAAGAVSALLKEENGAVIEKEQFCYRPVAPDREPIIGPLSRADPSITVNTAMGPWGITQAPGGGRVVAEMMLGLPLSADVSRLGVDRFEVKAKL